MGRKRGRQGFREFSGNWEQFKENSQQPEKPKSQDWGILARFFAGTIRGFILGLVSRLCWKYVLFTVTTMGVLSYTSEICIHWSRQRKQTVSAYNNFGFAGFTGMLLGLVYGVGAGSLFFLESERALEASQKASEATR
jgi:hypothetical protein